MLEHERREQAKFRRKYHVMMAVYAAVLVAIAAGAVLFVRGWL